MGYKPLVNVESGIAKQVKAYIENGKPEKPSDRLIYGGACYGGYVHLKTSTGEMISYPVNTK